MSTYLTIKGNLINALNDGEIQVAAHCCNCFHTMGCGIAAKFVEAFPEVLQADKETPIGDSRKLGTFSKVKIGNKYIFNLYGQFKYGRTKRHLSYDALNEALVGLKMFMQTFKLKTLGLPARIGCNNAGGSVNIVTAIIKDVFDDSDIEIRLYE